MIKKITAEHVRTGFPGQHEIVNQWIQDHPDGVVITLEQIDRWLDEGREWFLFSLVTAHDGLDRMPEDVILDRMNNRFTSLDAALRRVSSNRWFTVLISVLP